MNDKDVANICAEIYHPSAKWNGLWEEDIYAGVIGNVLCFRGSVTQGDWFADLDAMPTADPILGGLHCGFAKGMHEFFTKNVQLLHKDTVVCGHSLGAARALIFAGYMEKAGIRPKAVIVFGSPRPCFLQLASILQPVTVRSYKNRFDPVTDVPLPFYPDLPYIHPRQSIKINAKPPQLEFGVFADHHVGLYQQGTPQTEIT